MVDSCGVGVYVFQLSTQIENFWRGSDVINVCLQVWERSKRRSVQLDEWKLAQKSLSLLSRFVNVIETARFRIAKVYLLSVDL